MKKIFLILIANFCLGANLMQYDLFNHDDSVRELAIPAILVTAQDLAPGEKIVREINEQRIYCYRTLSR